MKPVIFGASLSLSLFLSSGAVLADTFPVTGTEKFETGLQRLATINFNRAAGIVVNWGDGTANRPGLYACGVLSVGDCDVFGTHRYHAAGTYTISITYLTPLLLQTVVETTTATIVPIGDFVILSIGDSVASGEGNPSVFDFGYWDDPGSDYDDDGTEGACHRSFRSGPGLVAFTVSRTNPVTFVHAACSGNSVQQTINGLRSARGRLPRIDVLLISAGANEVAGGFGNLLTRCIVEINNQCSEDQAFKDSVAADIASLDDKYRSLATSVACQTENPQGGPPIFDEGNCGHMVEPVPPLVLITEYFDPTHDGEGQFPDQTESVTCGLGAISPNEWAYLYSGVVVPLNEKVRGSASTTPTFPRYTRWEPVTGIQQDFLTHGYCADPGPIGIFGDSWVVKAPESLALQRDIFGTGHPNTPGQADYRNRMYARLVALNPPRTAAGATAGGQPYAFGTWTADDVEVSLDAVNPIRESGVGPTYYAVDNPDCLPDGDLGAACSVYSGPFTIDTSGQHTVSFFSFNASEGKEPPKSVQVWVDKDPPVMTCTADPSTLWPPNGKLVPVTTSVTAVDAVSGPEPFTLVDVSTNQGNAQADIKGFEVGTADTDGALRARRDGNGHGPRLYTLTYESADALGNVGQCLLRVFVPHDQGKPASPSHKTSKPKTH